MRGDAAAGGSPQPGLVRAPAAGVRLAILTIMVGATRSSRSVLVGLVTAAGCLSAPPGPAEEPLPTARCDGDPGPPEPVAMPWSIATLPGWSQADAAEGDLEDWFLETGVFTHVLHGSVAATPDGAVTYQGGDLIGGAQSCAAVVAAHRLGYPILVVLGGDRGDDNLALATDDANRAALVAGLIEFIDAYGYDGISIAWITDVVPEQLSALVGDLKVALADRSPRPLLTVDVSPAIVDPSVTADWFPALDAINLESYGADWAEQLNAYLDAGVPPDAIDLGIGLSVDDTTRADVRAKIDAAVAKGLRGVTSWEMGALESADDPRLLAYKPLFQ